MDILVAIVVIALIAAVAFVVIQRRPGGAGGLSRSRSTSPLDRRGPRTRHSDPMAAAVAEHAEATDPQDVIAAEQRLKAQARQVAAPMQADALRAEHQRAADQMANGAYAAAPPVDGAIDANYIESAPAPAYGDPRYDPPIDPATGAPVYTDPATGAPVYTDPADPRYDDDRADPRRGDPRR